LEIREVYRMKKTLKTVCHVSLIVFMLVSSALAEGTETELSKSNDSDKMRTLIEQKYSAWKDFRHAFKPPQTQTLILLQPENRERFFDKNEQFRDFVKLGPATVPYIIEILERFGDNRYYISECMLLEALRRITKWNFNKGWNTYQMYSPKAEIEEFSDQKTLPENNRIRAKYIWIRWFKEFRPKIRQHFENRFHRWKICKTENKTGEAEEKYQRILDLGIDAIPQLVEKISEGDSEFIDAISFLTDGELKSDASVSETVEWWNNNKEKWTIPVSTQTEMQHSFEIYLMKESIFPKIMFTSGYKKYLEEDMHTAELMEKPIITDKDIIEYDWVSHTVTISKEAVKRIPKPFTSFIVVADGKRCYAGCFWSRISSHSCHLPIIDFVDAKDGTFRIKASYPKDRVMLKYDLRVDKRIKNSLQVLGKLKATKE